jgi:hypothetical protein
MMVRLGFSALAAAMAMIAAPAPAGDWTQQIAFQDCEQLDETSKYIWYQMGETIGVRPGNADALETTSTTRLKCVVQFPGFAAIAMVLSFNSSTWGALPEHDGAGGDRRIVVTDSCGSQMIPLDGWPRWKEKAGDPAVFRMGPASWTYLFDGPTTKISVRFKATDSWPDRQITWSIDGLKVRVLEADQTTARPPVASSSYCGTK